MEQIQYLIPAAVIIGDDKKVLFIKKSTARTQICIDKWEIPGGTIKFGENFEEALKRKIKEYLGLEIVADEIIPKVHSYVTDGTLDGQPVKMQFHVIGVLCHIVGSDQITLQEGRIKESKWLSVEEFENLSEDERVPGDLEIIKATNLPSRSFPNT